MEVSDSNSANDFPNEPSNEITRRQFITQSTVAGSGMVVGSALISNLNATETPRKNMTAIETQNIAVKFRVNGNDESLELDPRVTLLDALRERLGYTGSKKGCDHGQCGACTVLVNGRRINSCLSLAVMHDGDDITTIEGLARGEKLHPLQDAFIQCDGFQCGYCTPGQILSGIALMKEGCPKTDEGIREMMSGNLCRCGAYNGIIEAIRQTRDQRPA